MKKHLTCALLAGLLAASAAYAQDDTATLPAATTVGKATYLSGGIGIDESTAMKDAASKYPLELVFAAKSGSSEAYIADVHVKITDRSGKSVIDAVSKGPYFLATLPDGSYKVEAISDGVSISQNAVLKKGTHKRLVYSWSQN